MKQYFFNGRHYKIALLGKLYPPYWDDGIIFHKSKGRYKRKRWKKEITHSEYRAYRTWKYNRKTQFK